MVAFNALRMTKTSIDTWNAATLKIRLTLRQLHSVVERKSTVKVKYSLNYWNFEIAIEETQLSPLLQNYLLYAVIKIFVYIITTN